MCEPVTMTAIGTALGASASTALATGLAATAVGTSVVAGGISAKAAYDQGQVAKQVGRNNQIMAEYAAQDAIKRGDEDAIKIRQRASGLKGAQRTNLAGKGLDLGVGTASELQDQTDFFGEMDQATARNNAQRDAWASRAGGANARAQGSAAARQGNLSAFSTLLATSGQVADKWRTYNPPKQPGVG